MEQRIQSLEASLLKQQEEMKILQSRYDNNNTDNNSPITNQKNGNSIKTAANKKVRNRNIPVASVIIKNKKIIAIEKSNAFIKKYIKADSKKISQKRETSLTNESIKKARAISAVRETIFFFMCLFYLSLTYYVNILHIMI